MYIYIQQRPGDPRALVAAFRAPRAPWGRSVGTDFTYITQPAGDPRALLIKKEEGLLQRRQV